MNIISKNHILAWILLAPYLIQHQEPLQLKAYDIHIGSLIFFLSSWFSTFTFSKHMLNLAPMTGVWFLAIYHLDIPSQMTTLLTIFSMLSLMLARFPVPRFIDIESVKTKWNLVSLTFSFAIILLIYSNQISLSYFSQLALLIILANFSHMFPQLTKKNKGLYYFLIFSGAIVNSILEYNVIFHHILATIILVIIAIESWKYKERFSTFFSQFHFENPAVIIVGYFAVLGFTGANFLQIPFSQSANTNQWIDHLFTAISAVCVTGLSVVDIGQSYSLMGQSVILILIQLGGLGMISMSAWTVFLFQSHRLSLEHERTLKKVSTSQGKESVSEILRRITLYVFGCEFIGAACLTILFRQEGFPIIEAIWQAIFLSVSAFCNAGFTLQTDSLMSLQDNSLLLLTVSLLVLAGGFSPLMILQIPSKIKTGRLSVTDKMVLYTTGGLLLTSFLSFNFMERFNSLQHLDTFDRIINSWFQAVTLRTAGFYSADFTDMSPLSQGLSTLMMFIGGNPGSTAGGIKTTTFAILFLIVINTLQGRKRVITGGRLITPEAVLKAMTVILLGCFMVIMSFVVIMLSQSTEAHIALFEVVSALSTVGLSLGLTPQLNQFGKAVICGCMLAGRVGPLTFMLFLVRRRKEERWRYPREEIEIS